MRNVAKRLASPVTERVYGRIDARAAEIRAYMDAQMAELAAHIEALDRYLPTVVNVIASQNAVRRESERRLREMESDIRELAEAIPQIFERMEFIRREVVLEQRYAHGGVGPNTQVHAEGGVPSSRAANDE